MFLASSPLRPAPEAGGKASAGLFRRACRPADSWEPSSCPRPGLRSVHRAGADTLGSGALVRVAAHPIPELRPAPATGGARPAAESLARPLGCRICGLRLEVCGHQESLGNEGRGPHLEGCPTFGLYPDRAGGRRGQRQIEGRAGCPAPQKHPAPQGQSGMGRCVRARGVGNISAVREGLRVSAGAQINIYGSTVPHGVDPAQPSAALQPPPSDHTRASLRRARPLGSVAWASAGRDCPRLHPGVPVGSGAQEAPGGG